MKPGRWVALVAGVLAIVASGWALEHLGALSAPVATRLVTGLAAALVLVVRLRALWPAGLEQPCMERAVRARPTVAEAKPPSLAVLRRQVVIATSAYGGSELHTALRPLLREIAEERLSVQQSISLDAEPELARELLGDGLWELVRTGRTAPEDRDAPGVPLGELQGMVSRLRSL